MGLKEMLEKRRQRKLGEKAAYDTAYQGAVKSKRMKHIREQAQLAVGKPPKAQKAKIVYRKAKAKPKRKGIGYLEIGKSLPQQQQQERFASLISEHKGLSLAEFGGTGRSMMDYGPESNKKKKRGFSLMDW